MVIKNIPFSQMNTDDAPHALPEGSALNIRNLRLMNNKDGRTGYFENIHGNELLAGQDDIPAGSETIATFEDPQGKFVIWFSHVPGSWREDRINMYDLTTNRYWLVAKSEGYENGGIIEGGLRFTSGVEYGIEIVGSQILWVREGHAPMKLDIGAAVKASNPQTADSELPFYEGWAYNWVSSDNNAERVDNSVENLYLACKPPGLAPNIVKLFDENVPSNKIGTDSFQFAFRYHYHTGEYSVLSPFSESSLLNAKWDDNFNAVSVALNPLELPLPQGVKYILLYVRLNSTGKVFLIKKWTPQEIPVDGVAQYRFYGDYLADVLDEATASEPFHTVPLESNTIEYAKGRVALADNSDGRDTPTQSSLSLDYETESTPTAPTNATRPIYKFLFRGTWRKSAFNKPRYYISALFVKMAANEVTGGAPAGYYMLPNSKQEYKKDYLGIPPTWNPEPTSLPLGDLVGQFKGKDQAEVLESLRTELIHNTYEVYLSQGTNVVSLTGLPASEDRMPPTQAFLSNSEYAAGVVFYDRFLRRSGVVYNERAKVQTPHRDFGVTSIVKAIGWHLNNDNPLVEIPEWAVYYAPVIRRTSRALFFVSGYATDIRYAVLDDAGGFRADDGKIPTDTENNDDPYRTHSRFTVGIALDSTSLVNVGLGYTYNQGDMCSLVFKDATTQAETRYELPVIGQSGKYIIVEGVKLKDTLAEADEAVYEVYTPNKLDSDIFYEVGQMYKVSDPSTLNRKFTEIDGVFKPDCYVLDRVAGGSGGAYRGYAMSPNDLMWKQWVQHHGRANAITELGFAKKPVSLKYSDTVIEGAQVNGISAFHALNEVTLPEEMGSVKCLQLTSRAQKEGTVMLAIGENLTVSVYLGEVQLLDQQGDAFVAKSNSVVGNINVMKGNYGTLHPGSVKQLDGTVFWFDINRKCFVRYDVNGLHPISDYKFRRAAWLFAEHIKAKESEGRTVTVIGGIEPFYREYLVQRRAINPDEGYYCASVQNIDIEPDPTTEYPNRIKVTWVYDNPTRFDYKYYDHNGILAGEGQHLEQSSPLVQHINQPPLNELNTQVSLKFTGRSNCGGGNNSSWFEVVYEAAAEPDDNTCEPLSWEFGQPVLTIAKTGSTYDSGVLFLGTNPVTVSDVVKPDWVTQIQAYNGYVRVEGTAPTEPNVYYLSFSIDNCANQPLTFSGNIRVENESSNDGSITFPGGNSLRLTMKPGESRSTDVRYTGTIAGILIEGSSNVTAINAGGGIVRINVNATPDAAGSTIIATITFTNPSGDKTLFNVSAYIDSQASDF